MFKNRLLTESSSTLGSKLKNHFFNNYGKYSIGLPFGYL